MGFPKIILSMWQNIYIDWQFSSCSRLALSPASILNTPLSSSTLFYVPEIQAWRRGYFSLNLLFSFSRRWLSKWIESNLARFAVNSSPEQLKRCPQAGLCSVWRTAPLCMERNEASLVSHTRPAPLYLVTFWISVLRRNHLHQMNAASVALSHPLPLCQYDASGRPNLYSGKFTYTYWIFPQILLYAAT